MSDPTRGGEPKKKPSLRRAFNEVSDSTALQKRLRAKMDTELAPAMNEFDEASKDARLLTPISSEGMSGPPPKKVADRRLAAELKFRRTAQAIQPLADSVAAEKKQTKPKKKAP